jgi:hypothetical protein
MLGECEEGWSKFSQNAVVSTRLKVSCPDGLISTTRKMSIFLYLIMFIYMQNDYVNY